MLFVNFRSSIIGFYYIERSGPDCLQQFNLLCSRKDGKSYNFDYKFIRIFIYYLKAQHKTFNITPTGIYKQMCICILDLDDITPASLTLSESTPTALFNVTLVLFSIILAVFLAPGVR